MDDWHRLLPHPDHPPKSVEAVSVALERHEGGRLWLRYFIEASLEDLQLPELAAPERADDLWETTCLELFVRPAEERPYREYNFAPSGRWAAYLFSSRREGRVDLSLRESPAIDLDASDSSLGIEVVVDTDVAGAAMLSVTAIVEEVDGTKSYWALAHPPKGPPDFHDPACFILELPPAPAA